ncbi:hypothetical protein HDU97_003629 [Phlyctochytrium planicorne]|nr:hypothetical protein HDU97_003629 [Phlyctochytrium planicorne]
MHGQSPDNAGTDAEDDHNSGSSSSDPASVGTMSCSWLLTPPDSPASAYKQQQSQHQQQQQASITPPPSSSSVLGNHANAWAGGAPPSPISPLSTASSPSSSSENSSFLRKTALAAMQDFYPDVASQQPQLQTPSKRLPSSHRSHAQGSTVAFRTALQRDPSNPNYKFRLAEHLIKTLRFVPIEARADVISEALELLRQLVDVDGSPDAMHLFACMLITGVPGISEEGGALHQPDYAKALVLFRAASKRGHADSSYHAALCYEHARGIPSPDLPRALKLYKRAAVSNHPGAMTRLARAHLDGSLGGAFTKNLKQAVKWLKLSSVHASKRHSMSLLLLACLYEGGFAASVVFPGAEDPEVAAKAGVSVDHRKCVELLRDAHAFECWPASLRLSKALWHGELGLQANPEEGLRIALAAARKGCVEAMMEVVWMYLGRRIAGASVGNQSRDLTATPGSELTARSVSTSPLDSILRGSPVQSVQDEGVAQSQQQEPQPKIDVDEDEAFYWARKAAQRGTLPLAEYTVAYFYENGIGISQDLNESLEWYKRAAMKGEPNAVARLLNYSSNDPMSPLMAQPRSSFSSSTTLSHSMTSSRRKSISDSTANLGQSVGNLGDSQYELLSPSLSSLSTLYPQGGGLDGEGNGDVYAGPSVTPMLEQNSASAYAAQKEFGAPPFAMPISTYKHTPLDASKKKKTRQPFFRIRTDGSSSPSPASPEPSGAVVVEEVVDDEMVVVHSVRAPASPSSIVPPTTGQSLGSSVDSGLTHVETWNGSSPVVEDGKGRRPSYILSPHDLFARIGKSAVGSGIVGRRGSTHGH